MTKTFLISPRDLSRVNRSECWPKESMEAHGAGGRTLEYIGSRILDSGHVYDYYKDEKGEYWHGDRMRLPNGQIISMEKYLFDTENIRKKHRQ